MEMFEMVAPCLLGVEGLVGEELRDMEAAEVRPENGFGIDLLDFLIHQ